MNIFALDQDPKLAAQFLIDKHVVKMCLETAQLLSTYCHIKSIKIDSIYKPTHVNHPCSIWLRKSTANVSWLIHHGKAIGEEYSFRYSKIHKSSLVIANISNHLTDLEEYNSHTPFALAMPDQYKKCDCIDSYRAYYLGEKKQMASWKKREVPYWWNI